MRRLIRYSGVSLLAFVLAQAGLAVAYGWFGWGVLASVLFSLVVSAVPAYILNRLLVWPDRGAEHANTSEGAWFLVIGVIGSLVAAGVISLSEQVAQNFTTSRATLTVVVDVAGAVATGIVWIARYFVLDRTIFHRTRNDPATAPAVTMNGPVESGMIR